MVKKTFLLSLILLTVQFSFGQDVFRKGNTGINIGGGYRTIGVEAYGGNIGIERSVYKIYGLGYIGVGLNSDILVADKIIPSGTFRVAYHAGFFRTKVLDIYAGGGIAFAQKESPESTLFNPDAFLGFRYKIKKSNFGFFSEMSLYGANYKVGICFIL